MIKKFITKLMRDIIKEDLRKQFVYLLEKSEKERLEKIIQQTIESHVESANYNSIRYALQESDVIDLIVESINRKQLKF